MKRPYYNKLRGFLIVSFILMILLRIVWMQLRTFPVVLHEKSLITIEYMDKHELLPCSIDRTDLVLGGVFDSEKFQNKALMSRVVSKSAAILAVSSCPGVKLSMVSLVRWNQWLVIFSTFFCVLLARFLSSSWLVTLASGVVVLSRGDILTRIGEVSPDAIIMAFFCFWFACMAHFIRTGAKISLALSIGSLIFGSFLDVGYIFMFFVFPVLVAVNRIKRKNEGDEKARHKQQVDEPTGVFKTLPTTFLVWLDIDKRWLRYSTWFFAGFVISCILIMLPYPHFSKNLNTFSLTNTLFIDNTFSWVRFWVAAQLEVLDFHLLMSLAIIFVAGFQYSSRVGNNIIEGIWLLIISCFMMIIGAMVWDFLDGNVLATLLEANNWSLVFNTTPIRKVFVWVEPVLLTMGVVGAYYLLNLTSRLHKVRK